MKASQTAAIKREREANYAVLAEADVRPVKGFDDSLSATLVYGGIGKGKTFFLTEAIRLGLNVFCMSTDLGRNGLRTVREELERTGEGDKFDKHLYSWDPPSYELVSAHLYSDYMEAKMGDWQPDVDVWDGFTTFQINDVDEMVLGKESKEMKDSEMREAGLVSGKQDWQAIKRGTIRPFAKWVNKRWGGKKVHKVLTCLEEEKEEESGFGIPIRRIRPYLQGAAAKLVSGPFDLVMRTTYEKGEKGADKGYWYTVNDPTDKVTVKCRGLQLPDKFPADPAMVWRALLGKQK